MNAELRTVLILGATGRFGNAAAQAFLGEGWHVRAQSRSGTSIAGAQPVRCDAMDGAALVQAAQGVDVIVHALNPSRYTLDAWRREARQMLAHAIAAARASGALLMLPGNIYNFGRAMPALLSEDSPEAADTPFGRIRREMEAALRETVDVDSIVLRAGEFFGWGSGVWFDQLIVRDLADGIMRYPGPLDRRHAWTYVPDFAQTFARVAARRSELRGFHRFHVPGHALTGVELHRTLEQVSGRSLKLRSVLWPVLAAAWPFVPMVRSLWTMRYVWRQAHALDGRALAAWLGGVPHTELHVALGRAFEQLGHGQVREEAAVI